MNSEVATAGERVLADFDSALEVVGAWSDWAEAEGRLADEAAAALIEAGVARLYLPRSLGGLEVDPVTCAEVTERIARTDPSAAWFVMVANSAKLMASAWPEAAVAHVLEEDPDVVVAASGNRPFRARADGDGYRITGVNSFVSGCHHARWLLSPAVFDEAGTDVRTVILPMDECAIVDNWHVLGMRGTGSKSVKAKDLFVPEHRALCMYLARGEAQYPGAKTNPHPHYAIPLSGLGSHCIAGAAVGNAQAALELTLDAVRDRNTNYTALRMREFQAVQLRVAAAGARVDAARLVIRNDCLEAQAIAEAPRAPTLEEKLRWKRNVAYAVQLCTEAVDNLHAMAGARGIYDHYPIQRLFRDAHALMGHIGFSWDAQATPWGQVALGGAFEAPPTL